MEWVSTVFDAGVEQRQRLHGDVRDSVIHAFDDGPEAVFGGTGLAATHFVANLED